jgi:hypothetical protein
MLLSITQPSGIFPAVSKDLIGFQSAQVAENCNFADGQLSPWYNYLFTELAVNKGLIKTLYKYVDEYWFCIDADVDIVPAPVSGDTENKIYYTGSGIPKKTNLTEATTGSGAMPRNFFPLAVPSPKTALTSAASPPPAGSGVDRYVQYIWTVVTDWGEESYVSPASTALLVKNGEGVTLSDMTMIWVTGTAYSLNDVVFDTTDEGGTYMYICVQAGTSGGAEPTWNETVDRNTIDNTVIWRCFKNNLATKRIYRIVVGDISAQYKYLDAINANLTTYDDTIEDDGLGESCPSLNYDDGGQADADWDPPPQTLSGITYMGNGILLGFVGKDLYACVPYRPWAWPISYINSVTDDIVAISSSGSGNTAIILTEGEPYLATGTSPASITLTRLPKTKPCLSKRGVETYGPVTIYPAADGLRSLNADGTGDLLTKNHHNVETWQALSPDTMHSCIHDNKYFGFWQTTDNEGGIVFDLITGQLTTLDFYTFATYVDQKTDNLYFLRSDVMSGYNEIWIDPDARSTTGKATQYDLTGGAGVMAGIAQPDYPRNLVVTLTDENASVTALSITIAGTLSTGEAGTETKALADLTVGSTDLNEAWSEIDSITIDSVSGAGAGDTIDIGWGKKFGLSNAISADSDIIKVNEDYDDADVDDLTISTTYNTVQFETDPNATHDYQVWYVTE